MKYTSFIDRRPSPITALFLRLLDCSRRSIGMVPRVVRTTNPPAMAEEEEDSVIHPQNDPEKVVETAEEDHVDVDAAVNSLMLRGDRLRLLREMERHDERERERGREEEEEEEMKHQEEEPIARSSSSSVVLDYNAWLRDGQRYHDDLKHVDYRYIDFGPDHWDADDQRPLIVEQDKSLGKGGFCWDAAYILGEYLSNPALELSAPTNANLIELGSGTGLCGMMIAKARPQWQVTLTDLPRLMPLLSRNVALNFDTVQFDNVISEGMDADLSGHVRRQYGDDRSRFASGLPRHVRAHVLEWSEEVETGSSPEVHDQTFDIIAGADVVASIYDPIALARTIHRLSHKDSTVYISFKERLSSIHRQFEGQLSELFGDVRIVPPTPFASRNRNPHVQILVARNKKKN